jgi:hypothetical protein
MCSVAPEYGGERVMVERHGKPGAAIVSTEDLRLLEAPRMRLICETRSTH